MSLLSWFLVWLAGWFLMSCALFYFDEDSSTNDDEIGLTLLASAIWFAVIPFACVVLLFEFIIKAGKKRHLRLRIAENKRLADEAEKARIEREAEAEVRRILSEQEVEERRQRTRME